MSKKRPLFLALLLLTLFQFSTPAIVSLTDFVAQQKQQELNGLGRCQAGEVYGDRKGCIVACGGKGLEDCGDVFGGVGDWEGVCGYGGNGLWQYFGSKCSACQEPGYTGYFVGKCDGLIPEIDVGIPLTSPYWSDQLPGVPLCKQNYIYSADKGCIPSPKTTSTKCKTDNDCKQPAEKCFLGSCISRCSGILCKLGTTCLNGQCIPFLPPSKPIPTDGCSSDDDCSTIQTCQSGTCTPKQQKCGLTLCKSTQKCLYNRCIASPPIDKCSTIKCQPGWSCKDGTCTKDPQSCLINDNCPAQERCVNGKCQYACLTAKCTFGCVHGGCGASSGKCGTDGDCGVGEKCGDVGYCVNKCYGVVCPVGKMCSRGECIDMQCGTTTCPTGTYCKDKQCVPDIYICPPTQPTPKKYDIKSCTDPRPDQKSCPTPYYFRAPDPLFCGIKADGSRINFSQQCSTCKDPSISYYFTIPCSKLPFICNPTDTCSNGACVNQQCRVDGDCPYDWQLCLGGKCVDRCVRENCGTFCRFGQCGYQEATGSCNLGMGCKKETWACVGSECVDLCLRQPCPANQTCSKGKCI